MKKTFEEINKMPAGRDMDILIAKYVLELENIVIINIDGYKDMNFSTDMNDAFDVVEKFNSMKLFKFRGGKEWNCYFISTKVVHGVGDTAPLAICRAALLVVEERTRGKSRVE